MWQSLPNLVWFSLAFSYLNSTKGSSRFGAWLSYWAEGIHLPGHRENSICLPFSSVEGRQQGVSVPRTLVPSFLSLSKWQLKLTSPGKFLGDEFPLCCAYLQIRANTNLSQQFSKQENNETKRRHKCINVIIPKYQSSKWGQLGGDRCLDSTMLKKKGRWPLLELFTTTSCFPLSTFGTPEYALMETCFFGVFWNGG